MKKIRIIFITIVLIIVGGIVVTYISKHKTIDESIKSGIPNENSNSSYRNKESQIPDKDLTFAVLGDIHENIDSLKEAINDLNTINPRMDALVLNGDTVDQGNEEQYDSVKKTIIENEDLLPKIIINNIGNHEFFNYDVKVNSPEEVQTFINRYLEFSGEEKVYHDTWVKDYHFISLGSEDGNSETLDSSKAFISKNQQNWLKEALAENYQKGKPIFVFFHNYLNGTGWTGVVQSEKIKKILSKYPEVILFSSHTHKDLNESSIELNKPFTMIHTGAVSYTIIPDESRAEGTRQELYIKGLYIEVDGNKVVVKGRDIKEKQWIFKKEISKE